MEDLRAVSASAGSPASLDEDMQRQLSLVRAQGDAYGEAPDYVARHVARDSGQSRAGDLWICYLAFRPGEGVVTSEDRRPAGRDDVRLGIAVQDAADGRFVPNVEVRVTAIRSDGTEDGPHRHALAWHPVLYQYVREWPAVGDDVRRLRVNVRSPIASATDPDREHLRSGVDVLFDDVSLLGGRTATS